MSYKGDNALVISNRSAVWNGVQKSLDTETFKAGNEYSFSVFVNYYSNLGTIDIYTWWNSANATID